MGCNSKSMLDTPNALDKSHWSAWGEGIGPPGDPLIGVIGLGHVSDEGEWAEL